MRSRALKLSELVSPATSGSWGEPSESTKDEARRFGLPQLMGRFVELSGAGPAATLTAAFDLVREAQQTGEPAAWISFTDSSFYPPDVAEAGVDLSRLAVVRVSSSLAASRAAFQLARSGGFGLLIVDFGARPRENQSRDTARRIPLPLQTRLVGTAQKHATAIVVLTEQPSNLPSLGSLVSLRASALRKGGPPWELELSVIKDKLRGPGQIHKRACGGPEGLL